MLNEPACNVFHYTCADHRCHDPSPDGFSFAAQYEGALEYLPQDLPPLHVHLLGALCGETQHAKKLLA